MARILAILFLSLSIFTSSFAGSDGENELSKTKNGEVKDCFETLNRGIFAFNKRLMVQFSNHLQKDINIYHRQLEQEQVIL